MGKITKLPNISDDVWILDLAKSFLKTNEYNALADWVDRLETDGWKFWVSRSIVMNSAP